MMINNTYWLADTVTMVDPWTFTQDLTHYKEDGGYDYIYQTVYYDGETLIIEFKF